MVSRLKQSLAFHASPEAFISDRQQSFLDEARSELGELHSNSIVKAQILNRQVHIVSSYEACYRILNTPVAGQADDRDNANANTDGSGSSTGPGAFVAGPAYNELMADFFPLPNLLLQDGRAHSIDKKVWMDRIGGLPTETAQLVRRLTQERFIAPLLQQTGTTFDLYDSLKAFSWDLLLRVFLGLSRDSDAKAFRHVEDLQEQLLRGQFSLLPVKISTPLWASARSKGIKASKALDPILERRWDEMTTTDVPGGVCPFLQSSSNLRQDIDKYNATSHLRLFTSSISNKAISSLLTAFFCNLFLWRPGTSTQKDQSLAGMIAGHSDVNFRRALLRSILLETERLSPPVVGVMRRVQKDLSVPAGSSQGNYRIPKGHDTWLYVVGANRDEKVFHQANEFHWDRFMAADSSTQHPLTFGGGQKSCLGVEITHDMCIEVAETALSSNLRLLGDIADKGVRQWLGWDGDIDVSAVARDMKQLPCQRPRKPLLVGITS